MIRLIVTIVRQPPILRQVQEQSPGSAVEDAIDELRTMAATTCCLGSSSAGHITRGRPASSDTLSSRIFIVITCTRWPADAEVPQDAVTVAGKPSFQPRPSAIAALPGGVSVELGARIYLAAI